ncbi:MAG TPA: hypothetical protein VN668_20390 [Stellaceae bacterium]|nr:hypothetical protein [Stellaceae bacterium]
MRGWLAWGGVALVLLFGTGAAALAVQPLSPQQVLKAFEDRVFVALPGSSEKMVLKWQRPVRFGLVSREGVSSALYARTLGDIEAIRQVTGKDFLVSSDKINFLVLFSRDTDADVKAYGREIAPFFSDGIDYHGFFQSYEREGLTCAGKMLLSPTHEIIAYLLFVSVPGERGPAAVDYCIARNLLRGMGVIAEPSAGTGAALGRPGGAAFTPLDQEVLRILYSTLIKSGEPEKTAARTVQRLAAGS